MRKFALVILGLVVVLVLAIVALPGLIGLNPFKPQIAEAVRQATGRDLRIEGDIELSIFPTLAVSADNIALSNAAGAADPEMVTLKRVEVRLALLPLLSREVLVERLIITEPVISLEKDTAGKGNWQFDTTATEAREAADEDAAGTGEAPLQALRLEDVRLEQGRITFRDATTGQKIEATDIQITASLADLASALSIEGGLVLNGEPVSLDIGIDSPGQAMSQQPFAVEASIETALVTAGYTGRVQQAPVPGLDGRFDLEVGSVGELLAWLGQPLDPAQPDPGALKVAASFKADGATVALEQATIEGDGLSLTATGSFDGSGEVKRVALKLESAALDIDRYLPPRQAGQETGEGEMKMMAGPAKPADMLAALPDEPLDLSALQGTEAEVEISIAGVKAAGYEVGRLAFTLGLSGGRLDAVLEELALYGGQVTGRVQLDASGSDLAVDAAVAIDQVDIGALAAVAAKDAALPVGGVASGELAATARGSSPRALASSLAGKLAFDLGGLDLQDERAAALSELKLDLELPGLEAKPKLGASAVYNDQKVTVALELAPLGQVLSGDPFELEAKVVSALVTAGYAGRVQQAPVPGLDGRFDLEVGSVGELLAWLGQPLDPAQPDPGALKVAASFKADGKAVGLTEALIDGKAFKARATGSFDGSGTVAEFDAEMTVEELDLNAYLPPPAETSEAPAKAKTEAAPAAKGWSEEPIDFAPLRSANGEIRVTTGPVRYRDLVMERSNLTLSLKGGVLRVDVKEIVLAEGLLTAATTLDASGDVASLDYQASIKEIQSKPFLKTFSGIDWLSGKANFDTKGSARGRNQKELVNTLNGDGSFVFLDGAIEGINLAAALRKAKTLGIGGGSEEAPKTDFSELSGSFDIKNGDLENPDLKMLAPLVRLAGAGKVFLPPQTIDYGVEAKLVASLEGQGGDEALVGLPIPIKITGPWSGLSYDVDWAAVFRDAATDPERLANMPDALRDQAKSFGVALPIPSIPGTKELGTGGVGEILKAIPGLPGGGEAKEGEAATGALGTGALGTGALLPGVGKLLGTKEEPAKQAPAGEAAPAEAAPAEAPSVLDPLKSLIQPQPSPQAPAQKPKDEAAVEPSGPTPTPDPAPAPAPAGAAPATEAPAPAPESSEAEELIEAPLKALKGLFGN